MAKLRAAYLQHLEAADQEQRCQMVNLFNLLGHANLTSRHACGFGDFLSRIFWPRNSLVIW